MKPFLQSDEWADFQKSLGRKTWQIDSVNIIKHNLPLNKNYLYSPRCEGKFLLEPFLKKVKEIAKKENSIFFKVEPIKDIDLKGFKKSTSLQPQKTIVLDIKRSEQEILKQMHQKTRYNIRLAEKKGIKIRIMNYESGIRNKCFGKFWDLLRDTAKRGGFHTHPKEYYEKMLKIPGIELFIAEHQNKTMAANVVLFYQKRVIYLHGASDYNRRNLMAPYLLQWEQIKQAKKRGCVEYDFWGINQKKWPGVTRFKKGFGAKEVNYPGAYDLVFNKFWYLIYKIARRIL